MLPSNRVKSQTRRERPATLQSLTKSIKLLNCNFTFSIAIYYQKKYKSSLYDNIFVFPHFLSFLPQLYKTFTKFFYIISDSDITDCDAWKQIQRCSESRQILRCHGREKQASMQDRMKYASEASDLTKDTISRVAVAGTNSSMPCFGHQSNY